jgi:hypothetical protein
MRPLHRLCEGTGGRPRSANSFELRNSLSLGGRTDIKAPHVLEAPPVITAAEYPRHVIGQGDGVRAEAVSWKRTPDWGLAPIHHRWRRWLDARRVGKMGDQAQARGRFLHRWAWRLGGGCRLAGSSCK